ncbi:sucrase ferredoxin [Actinomycetes bacterium KLBMP 9759]
MGSPPVFERCAVQARILDEPLAGTTPVARGWLCLEHRGAWPHDVTRHPDPAVSGFAARATALGWRLQLIRRTGRRTGDHPVRVFFADTAPGSTRLTSLTVEGPSELADVPLPVPGAELPGRRVRDPLLLVCTHGRRDRCCALDGRALALAVEAAGESSVWECTHLGGHRFAPTALVLPTGYLYGHLDATAAIYARKAAGLHEVEVTRCRGRSTWSPAGQVAELAVRSATGLRDADELTVEPGDGVVRVTARDGRRWDVVVEETTGEPRPASCGVAALPWAGLRATRVERVRHARR